MTIVSPALSGSEIPVRFMKTHPDAVIPSAAYAGDVGLDLCSVEDYTISLGGTVSVSTGLRIALPPGYEAQVRSRSGLASKHGLMVLNSPGTIDTGYRGEIRVILAKVAYSVPNLGCPTVRKGDRVAQLVIKPHVTHLVRTVEVENLDSTDRGNQGFGSSGA